MAAGVPAGAVRKFDDLFIRGTILGAPRLFRVPITLARRLAFSSALEASCAAMLVSTLLAVVVPKTEWVLE